MMDNDNLDPESTIDSEQHTGNAGNPTGENGEDKPSRLDAAKAFFRSLYAGEEEGVSEQQSAPPGENISRVKELEVQVQHLDTRAQEAESHYKRMAADFDNYRRRTEREKEDAISLGVKKAAEALLPALDDLDRALSYFSPGTADDSTKVIESFQLVAARIAACLETVGLKPMLTDNTLFDPRFHEPVQQIESPDHPDGTIILELRKGWLLGDKVIRPALVNVSSNPNPAPVVQDNSMAASAIPEFSFSETDNFGFGGPETQEQDREKAEEVQPDQMSAKTQPEEPRVYELDDVNLDEL